MNALPPQVAGLFYAADAAALRADVRGYLAEAAGQTAAAPSAAATWPKALVVPHAGYVYSAAVAARGYARLAPGRATVRRVVLLGTGHRGPIRGLATTTAAGLTTPLGTVEIDEPGRATALRFACVETDDAALVGEHSLEVQLPFLQTVLAELRVVPLLVGRPAAAEVADVIHALWGGPETVVVISSDLSHYLPYDQAVRLDRAAAEAIVHLRPDALDRHMACGHAAIRGLLLAAARHGLRAELAALRNSGDVSGERDQVVGYGAFAFYEGDSCCARVS